MFFSLGKFCSSFLMLSNGYKCEGSFTRSLRHSELCCLFPMTNFPFSQFALASYLFHRTISRPNTGDDSLRGNVVYAVALIVSVHAHLVLVR